MLDKKKRKLVLKGRLVNHQLNQIASTTVEMQSRHALPDTVGEQGSTPSPRAHVHHTCSAQSSFGSTGAYLATTAHVGSTPPLGALNPTTTHSGQQGQSLHGNSSLSPHSL